jgi:hypothetical protein
MGDAPSLWLNNPPVGSITSWADLSQAFTSNFQATYNRPGNAFNLGSVTMKTNERLRDYTNQFFENRNTVSVSGMTRSSKATRTVSKIVRSLRRSTSLGPLPSRPSWMSSTNSSTPTRRWSTSLTPTPSATQTLLAPLVIQAPSCVSDLQRCSRWRDVDL